MRIKEQKQECSVRKRNREIKMWAVTGGMLFAAIYGIRVLNPFYFEWIFNEPDLAQTFFGWIFYRQNKSLSTYLYGIEGLSYPYTLSVIFMDMENLLAILLKPVINIFCETNVPLQICGISGLMNYVLQGVAAGCIMAKVSCENLVRVGGVLVLVLSPYLLQRNFYHQTLAAQYIILFAFAIWIYRDRLGKKEPLFWILLFTYGTVTHIYFAPIVGLIMLAAVTDRAIHEKSLRPFLGVVAGVGLAVAVVGLLGGFCSTVTDADEAWGETVFCQYSSNLNTFLNSEGHSLFLKALPEFETEYEGFGYLGLGIILLVCADVFFAIYFRKKHVDGVVGDKVTFFCVAGLMVAAFCIAVGPRITLGRSEIVFVPIPDKLHFVFRIFRSLGRFIWIPAYLLMIGALAYFDSCRKFMKKTVFCGFMTCFVVIQVLDLMPYALERGSITTTDGGFENTMTDGVWKDIAGKCDRVYATDTVLTGYPSSESYNMHMWAFENNMKISSTRIAHGGNFLTAKAEEILEDVYNGDVESGVLYWFADKNVMEGASAYLHCEAVDGYYVGWKE